MRLNLHLVIVLFFFTSYAFALPKHLPVPGGVAIIELKGHFSEKPTVLYRKKPVLVTSSETAPKKWQAVVGILLSAKTGQHVLQIKSGSQNVQQSFLVSEKKYKEQRIQVKNTDHVSPKPLQLKRIRTESKKIKSALTAFDVEHSPQHLTLVWPVEGRHSGRFGLKRYFNDQPRSPHSGYDIAAPEGTPIYAPLNGRVVLVGDFFFTGNFVVLDHGEGMQTLYAHLHESLVEEGQSISQGEILGKVGKTGRATGPHLHWGVVLNGAKVDPSLFVQ